MGSSSVLSKTRGLASITNAEVAECARWWFENRQGWPGARAIPAWLTGAGFEWNPDNEASIDEFCDVKDRVRQVWSGLVRAAGYDGAL